MILGITGGMGSGKSELARCFSQLGAWIVDADAIAHRLLAQGVGRKALCREFGPDIEDATGHLDRRLLGRRALENEYSLQRLYAIIRPDLEVELRRQLDDASHNSPCDIVVFDVPLLYEWGIQSWVNRVVVVRADREVRIARIEKRSGLERVEIERRMALQMEEEDKCALADYVVDNSGTLSSLAEQAQILWQQFKNNND